MIARPKMSQNEWKTTEIRAWQSWTCLTLFLPRPRRWAVYREDFRPYPGGGPVCPLLRDRFGGPPCPDAADDGKWAACHTFARAARLGPENATQDFGFSKNLHCDGVHINFANLPRWHANFQATMLSRNATYAAHHRRRHDRARRPPS